MVEKTLFIASYLLLHLQKFRIHYGIYLEKSDNGAYGLIPYLIFSGSLWH